VTQHQPCNGGNHQDKAETQLCFQGDDFHQPGIQEGKGVTHAGNGQIEVVCDISHHHPGDNYQRAGEGVGEEADPCELDAIAVSHVWPVKLPVMLLTAGMQFRLIQVMKSKTH
jgi:hypothetical protein